MEVSARISLSGMLAHQQQIDAISNNLANTGTTGFKRARALATDAGYQAGITAPVGPGGANVRIQGVGEGAKLADLRHEFLPGVPQPTGNALDVALDGDGFLVVGLDATRQGYTRDGTLQLDATGRLVTSAGLPVRSADGGDLIIPADASAARFDPDGSLWVTRGDGQEERVGALALVRFQNQQGLLADGGNVWTATAASGAAVAVQGGAPDAPVVFGGALEVSNLDMADEFTRLMQAQRGYQLNLRMVQAWDEVARMAGEIRR